VSENELRVHPAFVEQTRGSMKKKLNMTIGYYRFIGIIKKKMMEFSRRVAMVYNEDVPDGFFDEPDYEHLSRLSENHRDDLLLEIARIICMSYDTEWWYILLQRSNHLIKTKKFRIFGNFQYQKDLEHFPRTKAEFYEWIQKTGGQTFLSQSHDFLQGRPYVRTKDHLIKVTIHDLTNTSPYDGKSKWSKSVTRHVTHFAMEEIGRIRDKSTDGNKSEWGVGKFQEILANQFVNARRKPGDDSDSIIWPTCPEPRMIRWHEFGPKIVRLDANELPHTPQSRAPPPTFPVRGNDVFFKNLVIAGYSENQRKYPQLNQIVMLRLLIYLRTKKRSGAGDPKNSNPLKNHYNILKLPGGVSLLIFFDNEAKLLECAKAMTKVQNNPTVLNEELRRAALYNQDLWCTRSDPESHELFHYHKNDEKDCDAGFKLSGNHMAFGKAQEGVITNKVLRFLMEIRRVYNEKRHSRFDTTVEKAEIQDWARCGSKDYSYTKNTI